MKGLLPIAGSSSQIAAVIGTLHSQPTVRKSAGERDVLILI
jgi:hypothetical protein